MACAFRAPYKLFNCLMEDRKQDDKTELQTDVVVIGGGLAGQAAAIHLARGGLRVTAGCIGIPQAALKRLSSRNWAVNTRQKRFQVARAASITPE